MNLPPLIQAFVLHFGEMGSRWGINRTVGQIYALLYVAPEPLNADQIVEALGVSRSNVSMGLRELQAWNLAIPKHVPNDRRDHYTTLGDVWEILRVLAEERKKREVDPTLSVLRELLMQAPASEAERHAQARMGEMHGLIEQLTTWYDEVSGWRRSGSRSCSRSAPGRAAAGDHGQGRLARPREAAQGVGTDGRAHPRPHPVRGEHLLPHPVPDHHHRARLGAAVLQAALQPHARRAAGWTPTASG
jgi:DNA-binding transcriptional regulator GbsR (MarR family)